MLQCCYNIKMYHYKKIVISLIPIVIILFIIQGYANTASSNQIYPAEIEFTHNGVNTEFVESRCTLCHNAPVSKNCVECHTELPAKIDNIYFPHHNITNPAGGVSCADPNCHNAHLDDVRYVVKPEIGHKYCENCHSIIHNKE